MTAAPTITGWRAQVQRLAPLELPLLPCGAGSECKAPMDLKTGRPMAKWQKATYTAAQIVASPPRVRSVGTRTGKGFIAFDFDGASAVALGVEQRCDPHQAQTWRVERDTDQNRLKTAFSLTPQQQLQLGAAAPKAITRWPNRGADGQPIDGDRGENLQVFHHPGKQVVVLGEHVSSGGNYLWPDGHGPEALAPIPPEWWELALAIVRGELSIPDPLQREPAAPAATPAPARSAPSAAPRGNYPPRTIEQVMDALNCYPVIAPKTGQREAFMALAWGLREAVREAGGTDELALELIEAHSPGVVDAAEYLKTEPHTIGSSKFFSDAYKLYGWRTAKARPDDLDGFEVLEDEPDPADEVGAKREGKAKAEPPPPSKPSQQRKSWDERNQRKLTHTRAMRCFDRCVEVQAQQQRNSLTRRARLLKALHDLDLAKYVNRAEISQKVLEAKDRQQGRCFKAITSAERIAMERPTVSWLIPGILPDGDASIIGGRPKVGKTRLAYALAAALLTGKPVFGFEAPAPRPVIVISDDQGDGDTADMLTELGIWDHPGLTWSRNFRLTESDMDLALAEIKRQPGALVIFDSLRSISRSLQYGENDPELGAIIYDLKEAVVEAGGTPVLIHHCNKTEGLVGIEALSGHSAIPGAANTILTVAYLPDEKGKPQKDDQQRRLHREARSGKPFDLVIAPATGGSFERVADFGEWVADQKKVGSEQEALGKMPTVNVKILEVLCRDREKWFTRREVCEARGVPWGDRGRGPEVQKVTRALQRLVKENFAESQRNGQEASFRAAGGGGEPHMGHKSDDNNDSDAIQ